MTTVITKQNANSSQSLAEQQGIQYTPTGETSPIRITMEMIARDIAVPTKNGKMPEEKDCLRFMNLCAARKLNPWSGDCFMLGFDGEKGAKFEMLVSYQALLKRAEGTASFEGLQGGVIVQVANGDIVNRAGHIVLKGETLIGGWAMAYRADRRVPHESAVALSTFDKQNKRWKEDPAGMITKCAKSAVLREAFPSNCGGMYIDEESLEIETREQEPLNRIEQSAEIAVTHQQDDSKAWAAEFKKHGVMTQAKLILESPTIEDAQGVLRVAKQQIGESIDQRAYDCLQRYFDHKWNS